MEMVEVKASELIGAALDWAVAKAEGDDHWTSDRNVDWFAWRMRNWKPSTDWSQGGPLIDKYRVAFEDNLGDWFACIPGGMANGETHLIASCRAIVAAKLGDTVQVPAELLTNG